MGSTYSTDNHPGPFTSRIEVLLSTFDNSVEHWNNVRTNTATNRAVIPCRIPVWMRGLKSPLIGAFGFLFFFAGFLTIPVLGSLIIQFPGELVELVDNSHLGVEDLVEAVSHEVGILVGSVTTVDEILEGMDN